MILTAKITTLIAWLFIIANWISPIADWQSVLHWSGVFLLIAHSIEVAVFLPAAKKAGGNIFLHALQLFVFGYAHNMQIEKTLAEK